VNGGPGESGENPRRRCGQNAAMTGRSVSLFDLRAGFFVPTHAVPLAPCRDAVKARHAHAILIHRRIAPLVFVRPARPCFSHEPSFANAFARNARPLAIGVPALDLAKAAGLISSAPFDRDLNPAKTRRPSHIGLP
jgi:hypothetical protein